MRRVEGPLATGTYIVITRLNNEDQLATSKARKNGIGYEMLTTKNRNDENIEVRTWTLAAKCFPIRIF